MKDCLRQAVGPRLIFANKDARVEHLTLPLSKGRLLRLCTNFRLVYCITASVMQKKSFVALTFYAFSVKLFLPVSKLECLPLSGLVSLV
jgi:hypothetical protein